MPQWLSRVVDTTQGRRLGCRYREVERGIAGDRRPAERTEICCRECGPVERRAPRHSCQLRIPGL